MSFRPPGLARALRSGSWRRPKRNAATATRLRAQPRLLLANKRSGVMALRASRSKAANGPSHDNRSLPLGGCSRRRQHRQDLQSCARRAISGHGRARTVVAWLLLQQAGDDPHRPSHSRSRSRLAGNAALHPSPPRRARCRDRAASDPSAHDRRRLGETRRGDILVRHTRHLDVDVDAIEQWSREFGEIPPDGKRRAGASAQPIAVVAARTRVEACDQHEVGGVGHRARRARHGDIAILERLAQHFQRRSRKLGQLVQEEDAVGGLTTPRRDAGVAPPPASAAALTV